MIPDKQMLEEAAAFAGTVPVKNIVPIWKKGTRYLYTGGSVPMRDAAIYVREIHGTTHTNFGVRLSKVPRTKRKKCGQLSTLLFTTK